MSDLIGRQAAIDALWKALHEYEDKTEKQFQKSEDLDVGDWILHRIFVQNMSDIDRQTILNLPSTQPELIEKTAYIRGFEQGKTQGRLDTLSAQPEKRTDKRTKTHACDLIDRQAAIEAVEHITSSMSVCVNTDECHGMKRMQRQAVIELANLQSAQPEPQWIPVSERLPESIRPVIVTWKNTDPASYYQYIVGKHFTGTACYKNGKWYWYSSTTEDMLAEYGRYDSEEFDEAIECIAWMPLPEPYRAERRTDE